jgi:hypothetical protein
MPSPTPLFFIARIPLQGSISLRTFSYNAYFHSLPSPTALIFILRILLQHICHHFNAITKRIGTLHKGLLKVAPYSLVTKRKKSHSGIFFCRRMMKIAVLYKARHRGSRKMVPNKYKEWRIPGHK